MTETAQGAGPAESEVASNDPVLDAANAFKAHLGQSEPPKPRDDRGRFAPTQPETGDTEIEAEEPEAELAEGAGAESHDEAETGEAAEEAQLDPVDLPTSWPSELAEEWQSLPAPLQDKIVQREAEREAAVNAKFQEAANVKRANEALITEAQANRQRFAEAAEWVESLIQPQKPSPSMLNPQSADYNPDAYHLALAQYEHTSDVIAQVRQQRESTLAQLRTEAEQAESQALAEIETRTRPNLLKDVPDLADAAKQPQVLQSLVQYAIAQGIPEYVFTDPEIAKGVTSAQLHLTWKAQQYDKMVAAKGRVQPKAVRPAAPPVRPGVTTSRSAVEATQRKTNLDRLARSGSVEDGAAIWKQALKG